MFENHRWWDVRRWMIMHTLFNEPYPIKGVYFDPVGSYEDSADGKSGTRPASFTYTVFGHGERNSRILEYAQLLVSVAATRCGCTSQFAAESRLVITL